MPRKHYTPTRIGVAIAIAILVIVVAVIVGNILRTPKQRFSSTQTLPPAQQQSLQPTDLQQVESTLGPFVTLPASNSNTPDTQYPAILLVRQDGSVAASQQWSVVFDAKTWAQQEAPQITKVSVANNYVTFATGSGPNQLYIIQCNQPFVLEAMPQQVMVIDTQGKQWSISSTRAETLRVHA